MSIRFTWDRQKVDRNRKEHEDVTFEEATTVTERADVIRIISARKADGDERRDYEQVAR